jgi:hypothetical protein
VAFVLFHQLLRLPDSYTDPSQQSATEAMPPNTVWEDGKFARVKELSKLFLKRFGPLIVTGLAAVAEHHWLGHEDEAGDSKARDEVEEPEDKHLIRKLEREVAELKKSLSQKARNDKEEREARPSPRIREEIVRGWRSPYQEEQAPEQHTRGRPLPADRPGPNSYQPYRQNPVARQVQTPAQLVQVREREYIRPSQRQHSMQRRRRHHRHSSVPNRSSYEGEFSDQAIHAGKVATMAGAVEAIHVGNISGDWIGPKGVRVGTTMAASYAASRSRDRDPENFSRREVFADVGTGLLVTRVVHGSSRRVEEDERLGRRGRRWSYCY